MSCIHSLAKLRAATTVGNFDFTNNGAPLTGLPTIITALNGTYTRNSVKNVVQNGALVSLSANQFGTSYDPVAGMYGYVPEPAATNLATNSDGNAATYGSRTNVADGTAVPGFTNGIAFGDNSVDRTAYKLISGTIGVVYSVSVFVIMDDGGAPVVSSNYVSGDMRIMVDGYGTTAGVTRHIGNGVYRISASFTAITGGSRGYGVTKQTGQSARTFRITGIQVETGLRATSYIATTGSTASRSADVLTVPLWINNVKDSQDGSTANWTRTNCTVATSGTSPNGSAQQVTASSTASTQFYASALSPAKNLLTVSVWVKAGNLATCKVLVRNHTNATDFTTGTLTYGTGVITGSGWTATDLGSGWFKCVYKTVTNGDSVSVGDTIRVYVGFVSGTYTSGDNFYFGGAQIEPGSVATAYRPTVNNLEYARNLASFSDGNAATYAAGNTADGTAVPSFTNGITFGDNSVVRTAYKQVDIVSGNVYTISFFVIMDDGGAPVVGSTSALGDLGIVGDGALLTSAITTTHIGNNVYRVSAQKTAVNTGTRTHGCVKYTTQTSRTFRITGIQVERGTTLTSYEPTNTVTPSANANIAGYSSAGYTLAVDQRMDTTLSASTLALELSDLTTANRSLLVASGGTTANITATTASVSQINTSFGSLGLTRKRMAASLQQNNVLSSLSGTAGTPDTSATMPTGLVMLHIANAFNFSLPYNGFIFRAQLIPQAFTQAQINGQTT